MPTTLNDLVCEAKREAGALVADLRVSDIRAAGELHERGGPAECLITVALTQ